MKLGNLIKKGIAEKIVKWTADNYNRGERSAFLISTENARNVYSLYTEEFSALTSQNIKMYLEASRRGLNYFKSALFEEIKRRDLHIGGVCQTRKLSVAGKHSLDDIDNYIDCPEDEELKEFVIENLQQINLVALVSEITDSAVSGVSNFEINWMPVGGKWMLGEVKRIPNELLVYDDKNDRYLFLAKESMDIFRLKNAAAVVGSEDRVRLDELSFVDMPPEKLLEVHSLDGNAQNGLLNGCIDGLIWAYLFKSYTIKDLHVFIELFAIPAIIGKYDPLMNADDKKRLDTAIKNFGNHFRMTVSKDADVNFVTDTNKGSSSNIFHQTLGYWDEKISIRVLGQTLTTQLGSTGSLAAAKTHYAVRDDLLRADIAVVSATLNELIKRLCDLNFDMTNRKYPVWSFPESLSIEDKEMLSRVYKTVNEIGYRVSGEQIEQELETGELSPINNGQLPISDEGGKQPTNKGTSGGAEGKKDFVKKFVNFVENISKGKAADDKEMEDFLEEIFDDIMKS